MAFGDLLRRLGGTSFAASPRAPELTAGHFTALAKLIGGLPVADLVALVEGRATVDSVLDLAAQAARIVGAAFPPAAITSREIAFGLQALKFVCDAAAIGSEPVHIEPGQNPIRGGFAGARGHV